MKLPVLKVNALPNLYKHCSTVYVLHIDLPPQSDDSFMQSYGIIGGPYGEIVVSLRGNDSILT